MAEMKSLNGYTIVDKDSRDKIYQMVNDGQNLYTGSSRFTGSWYNISNYSLHNSKAFPGLMYAQKDGGLWSGLYQPINVKVGEVYTLSAWVEASDQVTILAFFTNGNSSSCEADGDGVQYRTATPTIKRISATCTITKSGTMYARFEVSNNPNNAIFYILGIKLEKGNTPTMYIPDNMPLYGSTAPTADKGVNGDVYYMI